MTEPIEILIDNLKETFKAIEKFLLLGFTSSLVLIVLAITDRRLAGTQKIMYGDINAPAVLVAFIALGTYFTSGVFAVLYFGARKRIVKELMEEDPQIVEAILTYPSIVARIDATQVVLLACVGAAGMIAIYLFYVSEHELEKVLISCLMIGSPYLLLVGNAFVTATQERAGLARKRNAKPK